MTAPYAPGSRTDATRTQEQFRDRPVLAQLNPGATTETTLYTVAKGRMASARVYVAEIGGAAATIRINIQDDGAATANKQYVCYGYALAANDAMSWGPFELGADDVIRVYASTANVAFTANGYDRPRDTT